MLVLMVMLMLMASSTMNLVFRLFLTTTTKMSMPIDLRMLTKLVMAPNRLLKEQVNYYCCAFVLYFL